MSLREGSRFLSLFACSIALSILVLGCAQSQTREAESNGYSSNPAGTNETAANEKALREIREVKNEIQKKLPISRINWAYHLGLNSSVANAWTGPEHIYIETEKHDLWAVSRRTGNPVWTFSMEGALQFAPTLVKGVPGQAVKLEKQIRETEEELSSLRAQINPDEEKISTVTSNLSGLRGRRRELEDDDRLYAVVGTTMYVVDREYGNQVDRITLEFAPSAQPFANKDRVIVPSYAQNFVYFFNSENMMELAAERVRLDHPVKTQINQVEDLLLFPTTGGTLYGYSTDGEWIWRKRTDGELVSTPKTKGDSVYVTSRGMQVYDLSRFSGTENWTQHLETPISAAPWVGESALYVRDEENRFYSFDLQSGEMNWKTANGPRSFLFKNNEQLYVKNSSTKQIFILSESEGKVLNSGSYKPFSFVFRNKLKPAFLLIKENGLMISARASKIGVEITTENIERSEE